jgi:pimeloyl-ACP methyl ester carboxylesterase
MTSPLARRDLLALTGAAATAALPAYAAQPVGMSATPPWTEEGIIQRPGLQIHYTSVGSGPPLVLLHKLGGWIADWRHVAPEVAKHYRVIAIDSPGHGNSRVEGKPPYLLSLKESAATILTVLDELGIDKFAAVGNSLGGCIAVCLAALWPERVTHLGLLSVALYPVIPRAELDALEPPGTWGPNDEPRTRPWEDLKKRFGIVDKSTYDEQVAGRAKAGPWVRPAQRGVANAGVIDYLARVQAPTLLMYGVNPNQYHEYEKPGLAVMKRGRSVHIPNAGAFAQQDNPRETEKIILDFIDKGA